MVEIFKEILKEVNSVLGFHITDELSQDHMDRLLKLGYKVSETKYIRDHYLITRDLATKQRLIF